MNFGREQHTHCGYVVDDLACRTTPGMPRFEQNRKPGRVMKSWR